VHKQQRGHSERAGQDRLLNTCASHGHRGKSKITLTRKQTSEIKKSDSTGKSAPSRSKSRKSACSFKRDAAAEAPAEARRVEAKPTPAPEPVLMPTPAPAQRTGASAAHRGCRNTSCASRSKSARQPDGAPVENCARSRSARRNWPRRANSTKSACSRRRGRAGEARQGRHAAQAKVDEAARATRKAEEETTTSEGRNRKTAHDQDAATSAGLRLHAQRALQTHLRSSRAGVRRADGTWCASHGAEHYRWRSRAQDVGEGGAVIKT